MLSNQLKIQKERSNITAILDNTGTMTQDPTTINEIFTSFYSALYSPTNTSTLEEAETFLNNISLPHISNTQKHNLEQPLTLQEFKTALDHIPNNKSPGPDGYPAEFYKHFWDILSPLYIRMITDILQTGTIPNHRNTALITLILKPNKDPLQCSNYRPLSLINTDLKMISKALAM